MGSKVKRYGLDNIQDIHYCEFISGRRNENKGWLNFTDAGAITFADLEDAFNPSL